MEKYNYESWLNDQNFFIGEPATKSINGMLYLVKNGQLSEDSYKKIRQAQSEAFEKAVELSFETEKKMYLNGIKSAYNKNDFHQNEVETTKKILSNDPENNNVIAGKKKFFTITGSQYLKIKSDFDKFRDGKLQYAAFAFNRNMILTAQYHFLNWLENKITGFSCPLHPDTIKDVYYFMAEKFIKGALQDFQTIFSNSSNTVTKPIQWLVLNERGKNYDRGNQTALNVFLKLMLGTISNNDRKKAKDFFIDEKGYFIEKSLLTPDKDKISGYGFETGIKEIIQKADH